MPWLPFGEAQAFGNIMDLKKSDENADIGRKSLFAPIRQLARAGGMCVRIAFFVFVFLNPAR